jgi:hypothetical protein
MIQNEIKAKEEQEYRKRYIIRPSYKDFVKVILKYNMQHLLGIISTSFLPRFIEVVSAVLRKLKIYENAPPSP